MNQQPPANSLPPRGTNRPGAGVPGQQVQTVACQVCGTVRLAIPEATSPLAVVGQVRIRPCPVCQLLKVAQALSAQDIEMREHVESLETWAEHSDLIVEPFGAADWSDASTEPAPSNDGKESEPDSERSENPAEGTEIPEPELQPVAAAGG